MSLRDRVPVEPLDPERWGHLEQRIVAHAGDALATPMRRRWWPLVAAVGVAGAVAAAALALRPEPGHPAAPLVVTADARGAHVELGDAVIDAEPGTRFTVTRPDGGVRVALAAGAVTLEVEPRRERPPLWVVAGEVSVRVVGTGFTVRRDPEVSVSVDHGVVEVDRGGAAVAVSAGQRWTTADGVVAIARGGGGAGGGGDGEARPDGVGGGAIAATVPADDALALSSTRERGDLKQRHAAVPPATGGSARVGPTAGSSSGSAGGSGARAGDRSGKPATAAAPATDLRSLVAAQPIAAAPAIGAATPADAIAAYQRALVDARGPAASAAQWGLARAQWSAGKTGDALRSLDAYLRRFTTGAELDAVRWLRLRLLCARAFDDTCRAAAHTYASDAADGPRRDLAVLLTQTR